MSTTPRLNLPYIAPQQAQKQVTYNAAMAILDQLVQPAVLSRSETAPPASPAPGDTYIVAPAATGAWSGKATQLATWRDGSWAFRTPADGWLAWVLDAAELAVAGPGGWSAFASPGGPHQPRFGINAAADLTTRLAVAADATLFTHDGAGHQLKLDKASAGDTASLLFHTGASGRAEIGLAGDDNLHLKVSPDGTTWQDALAIASATGLVSLPVGQLAFPASTNPSADPNTLDDYEEGTWTPVLAFGGNSVGITYGTQVGRYTKVGRLVHVACSLVLTSKGSSTGAATITGLPFTVANDGLTRAAAIGFAAGFSGVTGAILATIPANASRFNIYQSGNGSGAGVTNNNFGNTSQVHIAGSFEV